MSLRNIAALFAISLCFSLAHSQSMTGTSPTDDSDCDVAVIGGGPGGMYTAYRMLETNASITVCLFEATGRVGGRLYSVRNLGPNKDLTLDMGAYRYMPLVQPLITDIIQNLLQLPNRLYQPAIPDYKIVLTPDGSNAGFATWVKALEQMSIEMGLQMNYNTKITKLSPQSDGSFILTSAAGRNITADTVVLNLPSRPLNRLLQNSGLPRDKDNDAIYSVYQIRATKLYLFYPQAWWLANGINNGSLAYNLPWNETQPPKLPIIGRYYDAQVKCQTMASMGTVSASSVSQPKFVDYYYEASNSMNVNNCYGYIQATYTSDAGTTNISHYALDYLVDYSAPTTGPDGNTLPYSVWDNSTAKGRKLLNDAHTQLMAYHQSKNISLQNVGLPTEAVVALWDPSVEWSGGAWHANKTADAGEIENTEKLIKPYDSLDLFIADEAYGTWFGWAEGSLVMAENIVTEYFGAMRPSWMRNSTYTSVLIGPNYSDSESVSQGGGLGLATSPTVATAPTPLTG